MLFLLPLNNPCINFISSFSSLFSAITCTSARDGGVRSRSTGELSSIILTRYCCYVDHGYPALVPWGSMLVRAARRRFQHRHYRNLQPCFEDLHLPWLCPAVYREVSQRQQDVRKTSTIAPACSTRDPRQSYLRLTTASTGETPSTLRGLASAAAIGFQVAQDDFIPFEGSRTTFGSPSTCSPFSEPESISTLRGFDPSSTIVINDSLSSAPRKFRSVNAISGEIAEIQQTLHACLQVGRFERAAALMRRLNKIFKPEEPELLSYHNNYLRELSLKIMRTRDRQLLKDVHRWFEVDLRGVGVIPDPTTYFLMIQASLKEPVAKKAQRTVRRYLQFAKEAGLRDEVMKVMLEFMDEQDFGRVTSVSHTAVVDLSLSKICLDCSYV